MSSSKTQDGSMQILAEREVNRARNAAQAAAVAAQNLIASAEGNAASAALPRAQPQAMFLSSVQNALYEQSSTDSSKLEALVTAASLASSATAQPHSHVLTRSRTQAATKLQSNQPEASTQGAASAAVAALAQEQNSNMHALLDAIMLESEGSQASEHFSPHQSGMQAAPDASAMLAAGAGVVSGNPLFRTSSTQSAVTSRKRPAEDTEAPVAKRRTRRN